MGARMDIVYFVALQAQIVQKLTSSPPTNVIPRPTEEKSKQPSRIVTMASGRLVDGRKVEALCVAQG